MPPKLIIDIPNPCFEDWDKMQVTQKGKMCNLCGRFSQKQLTRINQAVHNQVVSKPFLWKTFAFLLATATVNLQNATAFEKPITEQEQIYSIENKTIFDEINTNIPRIETEKPIVNIDLQEDTIVQGMPMTSFWIVKGVITDKQTGTKQANTKIFVKNYEHIKAITDKDGNYMLNLTDFIGKDSLVLVILGKNVQLKEEIIYRDKKENSFCITKLKSEVTIIK